MVETEGSADHSLAPTIAQTVGSGHCGASPFLAPEGIRDALPRTVDTLSPCLQLKHAPRGGDPRIEVHGSGTRAGPGTGRAIFSAKVGTDAGPNAEKWGGGASLG